jgi:hypothetical protein
MGALVVSHQADLKSSNGYADKSAMTDLSRLILLTLTLSLFIYDIMEGKISLG